MKKQKKDFNPNIDTGLFGISGSPIKHTFSPLIQNAWFKEEKLNCIYIPFEISPKDLKKAVESFKLLGFSGLNITVPHKSAIMKYTDYLDKAARAIGSVNTLTIKDGKIYGYNTDHSGFTSDLISKNIKVQNKNIFIFGAGGASRAVIYSLKNNGAKKIYIANRTHKRAVSLAKEFKITAIKISEIEQILPETDLLINASSCGLNRNDTLPFEITSLKKNAVVYDLIYNRNTPFIKAAKKNKIIHYSGEGMLINQGAHGFKIWTGIYPNTKSAFKLLDKFMR